MIPEARVSSSSRSGHEPGFSNRSVNSTDFYDVDQLPIAWRINQIPSKKTKTLEPEDRISKLPDSILLHILTFLPITDTIRTTLLSKRWVNLWVSIPSLVFRFDQHHFHNVSQFISFVDRTLILCNSEVIPRFGLDFFNSENRTQIDSWLRFAANHKVEELDLIFSPSSYRNWFLGHRNLPRFIYMNGTLTKLNLRYCNLRSFGGEINWPSLMRLSFRWCYINDAFMPKLLAGCPVLESLELHVCHEFTKIDIDSVSLKELVINDYSGLQSADVTDAHITSINAPNLRLLDISGHMFHTNCQVENLSSLVEARLSFGWNCFFRYNSRLMEFKTMLTESLERIKHVKKLTLRMFFLQVISLHYSRPLPSPLSVCKNLILDADLEKGGLHGLASMLQSCPVLETLTIHLLSPYFVPELRRNLLYKRKSFGTAHSFRKYCTCLQRLKMVNIIGLVPGCTETEFVIEFLQFLLKHAKVLEKLSIDTSQDDEHTSAKKDSLFEVAKVLLRIPRLSPFAEIQLN